MESNSKGRVTFDQVSQAVADLKQRGCHVSIRTVRDQIGAGSNSTISKFLKRLTYCEMANIAPIDYSAQCPDHLSAIIQSTYAELVGAANAAANGAAANKLLEVQRAEDKLRARWAVHVKDKVRALRSLEIENQNSANLKAELKQVTEKTWADHNLINSLTARAVKAESENEHLLETVQDLQKRCANLEKHIEHFDVQTLRQRESDSQMYSLRIAKLEQDLMNSQSRVVELSKELVGPGRRGDSV